MTGYRQRVRTVPLGLLLLYTAFIALITLSPTQLDTSPGSLFAWLRLDGAEKLANLALFVPFGFLLALQCGRRLWWIAAPVGLAFSALIEGIQATLLAATRVADVSDLVFNSIGAGIGALLALALMLLLPARVEREPADFVVR